MESSKELHFLTMESKQQEDEYQNLLQWRKQAYEQLIECILAGEDVELAKYQLWQAKQSIKNYIHQAND